MTTLTTSQTVLERTREARARAEALLESLLEAKAASERRLAENRRTDHLKQVTGRSSFENAIDSTRRMIATLDRGLAEAQRERTKSNGYALAPELVVTVGKQMS